MSKLTDMLNKYRRAESVALRVGILDKKTYPDGELVAQVGYINEYGYTGKIPARKQKIYHSVDSDGNMKYGGKFVKASKANLERIVDIPAYDLNIPARPFFRTTIENNRADLPAKVASLMQKHDVETALRLVGEYLSDELQESVITWEEPPNAPSTIRAKGYNAPLRGPDRLLRNSFSYEIEK